MKQATIRFSLLAVCLAVLLAFPISAPAKAAQPKVQLHATTTDEGIVLSWNYTGIQTSDIEDVSLYQVTRDEEDDYLRGFYDGETSYTISRDDIPYGENLQYYIVVSYRDSAEDYYEIQSNTSDVLRFDLHTPTITKVSFQGPYINVKFPEVPYAGSYTICVYPAGSKSQLDSFTIDPEETTEVYTSQHWDGFDKGFFFNYSWCGMQVGKTYDITVTAYPSRWSDYTSPESKRYSITVPPEPITGVKVTNASESSNTITWEAPYDITVDQYQIWYATAKNGTYKKLATVSKSKTSYTHKNLKLGQEYWYRVYAVVGNTRSISATTKSAQVTLAKVKNLKATLPSATKLKLTWTKHSRAKQYIVYRAVTSSDDGELKYKKYKTVKQTAKPSLTMSVTNGKYYGFKVVAVGTVNGTSLTGNAAYRTCYADKFAYENESYAAKCKRVFGKATYTRYTSAKQAQKNMTTVTVKVWDFESGMSGKKVTRRITFQVHKKIAPTVRKIFEEIYYGKEKAPVYSIGGYGWRGNNSTSEHCLGLALDINPEYNYFIEYETQKVMSGKYWNPKKYAYSIKRNGDIENTFRKYGFTRGIWSRTADYMHFSYFGT